MDKELAVKQEKMEQVICRFIRADKPPLAMYDIGVGPKTEWSTLKNVYPKMNIYGCEPLVDLYPNLKNFPGRIEQVAIAPEDGWVDIHYQEKECITASLFPMIEKSRSRKVPSWMLDTFDRKMGSPKRILLWMDIEGMELLALKSGIALLDSHRVRWINLEERIEGRQHPAGWCRGSHITSFLSQHGYQRAFEYNRHRAHQDVIYVSIHESEKK